MSTQHGDYDTGVRIADIDPDRPRPLETPWGSFALFLIDGRVFAVQSFCPHLMGPLFQGTVAAETVTCPWHQWRFSLRTGKRVDGFSSLLSGADDLVICDVVVDSNGTVVLSNPHRDRDGSGTG